MNYLPSFLVWFRNRYRKGWLQRHVIRHLIYLALRWSIFLGRFNFSFFLSSLRFAQLNRYFLSTTDSLRKYSNIFRTNIEASSWFFKLITASHFCPHHILQPSFLLLTCKERITLRLLLHFLNWRLLFDGLIMNLWRIDFIFLWLLLSVFKFLIGPERSYKLSKLLSRVCNFSYPRWFLCIVDLHWY